MDARPYPDRFDLHDHVVIITGGAGLLGKEFARSLAQSGAHAVIAEINLPLAQAVVEAITSEAGTPPLAIQVDVTDPGSVHTMVAQVLQRFGRIDGLVNSAALDPKFDAAHAGVHTNAFEDYPLELWNQGLAVNLTGMFLCAQAVAPAMLAQRKGSIVNLSSIYGLAAPDQRLYQSDDPQAPPQYKPVIYTVTKSAVIGLTKYLATYWGDKGIRVNTLTPGGTYNNHPDTFEQRYSARTPMGRMGDKGDYCGALLYLLSDASAYMTGANLVVDGGWTTW
jgi:NAD(P)-dependent dehydrogenase (short-subunit alcohol dehydrogenase family)